MRRFQTYFPHVDNIYSHRSTQKYKRKPFISHYWDCRLKGRPPGTPKSDDPNKKKRKRTARQRDLCDVKIKITEYFPGAAMTADLGLGAGVDPLPVELATANFFAPSQSNGGVGRVDSQPFGVLAPSSNLPIGHPGASGAKYYTIQRVNGNGGNGKTDGVEGPHKHTLADSDKVKKNSVLRWLLKEAKEKKKSDVRLESLLVTITYPICSSRGSKAALPRLPERWVVDGFGSATLLYTCLNVPLQSSLSSLMPMRRDWHFIFTS